MAASSEFKLTQIGQIAIAVTDVARAEAFYRHKLGLTHLFTVSNMAFFDCGGLRLMLSIPEVGEAPYANSIIYFKVADIEAAYQELSARGVQFEGAPHLIAKMENQDLWMAFFRDSEANFLGIMSEVAPQ